MKVGITGHQEREGIEWAWVRRTIRIELGRVRNVSKALSSLAAGSDQVFAEVALDLGIPLLAVLPLDGYERFLKGAALGNYRRLLAQSERVQLLWKGEAERAFFEAGKYIVDESDVLFAVWDGAVAEGVGGTGDVVGYAQHRNRRVVHINPVIRHVERI
jgi:hypothetical protein